MSGAVADGFCVFTDREVYEYAETIGDSSAQLLNIVNDALDLIQIETQKVDLNLQPLDIVPTLDRTAKLLKEKAGKAGVALVCRPGQTNLVAVTNERRLREIIKRILAHTLNVVEPGCQISLVSGIQDGQASIQILGGRAAPPKTETDRGSEDGDTEQSGADASVFAATHLSLQLAQALAKFVGGTLEISYPAEQAIHALISLPLADQQEPARTA